MNLKEFRYTIKVCCHVTSWHDFDSYWTKTETYEALKKYIQLDMYNLKALVTRLIAGGSVPVNPDKFQNDMTTLESADGVLTLLVHLGYLTYDFYNQRVTIPNQEVQKELQEWYSSQEEMLISRQ